MALMTLGRWSWFPELETARVVTGPGHCPFISIDCKRERDFSRVSHWLSCIVRSLWTKSSWIIVELSGLVMTDVDFNRALGRIVDAHASYCEGLAAGGGLLLVVEDPFVRIQLEKSVPANTVFASTLAAEKQVDHSAE